jgi:hypothetical protein
MWQTLNRRSQRDIYQLGRIVVREHGYDHGEQERVVAIFCRELIDSGCIYVREHNDDQVLGVQVVSNNNYCVC